jgi:hypothetical protein
MHSDDLYRQDFLHEMLIEFDHLISIQNHFVIMHHQQLKQDHRNPIDDENHWHWLLNPIGKEKRYFCCFLFD